MNKVRFTIALALLMSVFLLFTACGGNGAGGNPLNDEGGNPPQNSTPDSAPKTFTLTAAELPQTVQDIRLAMNNKVLARDISITFVITDEKPSFAEIGATLYEYSFSDVTLDLSHCTGVSKVAEGDFKSFGISKLILPEGIIEIEYFSLPSVNFRSIVLPSTLTSFESGLLSGMYSLEEVVIAEHNPNYCSIDNIVYTKDKSTLIFIPKKWQGTSITLPKEVSEIEGLNLSITPFGSLKNLETIVVEQGGTTYASANGALLNADKTELLLIPSAKTSYEIPATVTSLKEHCISDAKSLEAISVAEGSVSYSSCNGALLNAEGTTLVAVPPKMKSYEVPSSVTEIADDCFWWCQELESVIIPEGVKKIGDASFVSCSKLTELAVPSTVTYIGFMFLDSCSKCKTLIMKPVTPPATSLSSSPFFGDVTDFTIKVPAAAVADYQAWALSLKSKTSGTEAQKWQKIHDALTAME